MDIFEEDNYEMFSNEDPLGTLNNNESSTRI